MNATVSRIFPPAIVGVSLIAIWYLVIYLFDIPIFQLPAPHDIIEAGSQEQSTLISGALQTTLACLIGFFTSLLGGVLISVLLAYSSWAYKGFYPYILLLKMMPVIVLAPIIILWFGQGLASITVITFLICFFPIVANTTMGLCSTDKNLVDVFRVYNSSARDEMLKLRIPYAMPYFLTGLKVAAALTPIGALYGDTVAGMGSGSDAGLGFVVVVFSSQLKIPALYAAAFTACFIGFLFVSLVNILHWRLLHKWHDSYAQSN
ncbi:ABC transporter permease [Alteromonas aestuariivivens]|uniref:ABC transporter permease n=1 Tax=Alteromonas aestuariivivens TaxID=1938339 RepID=A0A3D8MF85_9ALTE|nr:ABC transporter permease [Alteromonas aestuariivivens]RDV29231.1 ABC transporter permease [Alteromonas aestuariivivens]